MDDDYYFLWRVEGESSAEWPVCVYGDELTVLPYGFVEFLTRACTGRLPHWLQLKFRDDGHEFLHWLDRYRRDQERYRSDVEQYGPESYLGG